MWFCILETIKMNDVNRNRINNYLYHYSVKNKEENFKKRIFCIPNNFTYY